VLTDMADLPPHFWIEPGQRQHFICGTARAVEQARAMGHADERIHATSGMVIRPDFYAPPLPDRAAQRQRLGLDAHTPTGLVMFGGHGAQVMERIARELDDVPLVLVCGHNQRLAQRLRALPASAPRVVLGFSTDVPQLMQCCDFFIGKPGPGSLSEAVQQGLPVIVVRNAWTLPQERYNTQWVIENRAGLAIPSFSQIGSAVAEMTGRMHQFRTNVALIRNLAVFEIPQILDRILEAALEAARMPEAQVADAPSKAPALAALPQ
jgi:UDP-N-acetylglucosamine:LPS N-acetylglucosamine transferase